MAGPLPVGGAGGVPLTGISTPAAKPGMPSSPSTGSDAKDSGFGDALSSAIQGLQGLSARADASAVQLATGQPVDLHEVMLNMEQASLGFQTALQVRNKL